MGQVGSSAVRPLRGSVARIVAETEYGRFVQLLDDLSPSEWGLPTDCELWDVRLLVAHVLGATEANASPVEMLRQLRRGRTGLSVGVDEVSAVQVAERSSLTPAELVDRLRAAADRAVRLRSATARWAGLLPVPVGAPVNELWRVRYLMEVIYTRDVWMHRVDVARATGRPLMLTPDHDRVIVADIATDWARRHGHAYRLTLTGPAGGEFAAGADGDDLVMDAVEFCRTVSGRRPGAGLFAVSVPF